MEILIVGAALSFLLWRLLEEARRRRHDAAIQQLLATFAPGAAAVHQDPKLLLVWYPLAQSSRKLFPDEFAALDKAAGRTFPFTKDQVQAAHARCTSEWLVWERAHDAAYSVKVAAVQDEIARGGAAATPLLRTRLAAVEQEKLEKYQQRYEEYIRTAKALAALTE